MRILFVTARPPWPSRRGDQARTAGWVRGLAQRHEVSVVALRPRGFPAARYPAGVAGGDVPLRPGMAPLAAAFRMPIQVAVHVSARLRRTLDEELARFRPHVVVPILSRMGWIASGMPDHGVPIVIDLVDSLKLNMENRAHRQPLLRPLLTWEARRLGAWDRALIERTAAATVVSQRDRRALVADAPELAPKVRVVPFGVAVPDEPPELPVSEIVIMSGNLGYFPTVDGARWFAEKVWPLVKARRPTAVWCLAGARPARVVRRLAAAPDVRLHADPRDLGALRRQAAVAAVPLHSGSGTPIKILEAMAGGVPVVTTRRGREGLDEIGAGAVTVADEPEDFAAAISRLLADRRAAARQSRLAWEWVRERHALPRVVETFERLLQQPLEGR